MNEKIILKLNLQKFKFIKKCLNLLNSLACFEFDEEIMDFKNSSNKQIYGNIFSKIILKSVWIKVFVK